VDLGAARSDRVELPRTADALSVYDLAGRRVVGKGPGVAPALVRRVLRAGRPADGSSDGALEVAVPLLADERVTGAVRAVRSDAGAMHDARRAWLVIAAIAVGIIAAAILAALLLGRRLAAPMERLAAAARRLGEGDFSVRAPAAGISEVDAVGAALDTTARRLDDLVARERAFSADASHQLRTPLQALRIELEAMELRDDTAPELPAAIGQVDRLQATVDTLLAVARDAPHRASVSDAAVVLTEVEARWHGQLAAQGRPLRITLDTPDTMIQASGAVLTELLDVLIDNADRHGRGAVTVQARLLESCLVIDVSDEGPGFSIDPEIAFQRRAAASDGHGIGLALARSLAHAEGGRLSVSRSGPGPVLTVMMPRAETTPVP
jgi:signal transduction histidine kinase